jgi:hypothetical protein
MKAARNDPSGGDEKRRVPRAPGVLGHLPGTPL